MKRIMALLVIILFVAYPVIVYFGLSHLPISVLGGSLFVLFMIRLLASLWHHKKTAQELIPMALGVGGVLLAATILQSEKLLLFVPVAMNVVLLLSFGATLFKGTPMIERFATLAGEEITERVQGYCRRVTWVWVGFFSLNGTVALYTVLFASKEVWTLYNGLISYTLIGALMGVEYLFRLRSRRRGAQEEVVE